MMAVPIRIRIFQTSLVVMLTAGLAACYPRYDWREARPDCSKGWCGFVATFPGKATTATRDVPVAAARVPLSVSVVSVGDVTFAIGAFELGPTGDFAAAQAVFERKLLDDTGTTDPRQATRGRVEMHAADRSSIAAETFEAEGRRDGKTLRTIARFVRRDGRLIEIFVVGPAAELSGPAGRQAVETFLGSVRLD